MSRSRVRADGSSFLTCEVRRTLFSSIWAGGLSSTALALFMDETNGHEVASRRILYEGKAGGAL